MTLILMAWQAWLILTDWAKEHVVQTILTILITAWTQVTATNQRVAVLLTKSVGTMACFYLFALLAVMGFPGLGASAQTYVQWASSSFIQLVLLPLIMVGQDIMSQRHNKHHAEVMAAHREHGERLESHHDRLAAIEQQVYGKRLIAKRSKKTSEADG